MYNRIGPERSQLAQLVKQFLDQQEERIFITSKSSKKKMGKHVQLRRQRMSLSSKEDA